MKTVDSTAPPSRPSSPRAGRILVAAIALILVASLLAPRIPQDQSYHGFADQRTLLGVPNGADVLSNLAFALVGIVGLAGLLSRRRLRFNASTEAGLWLIAVGIIGTAAGSAWYHLNPTNATLFWDRLPMTVVFAGVLAAATSQRLGEYVGRWVLAVLPLLGIASVAYWSFDRRSFTLLASAIRRHRYARSAAGARARSQRPDSLAVGRRVLCRCKGFGNGRPRDLGCDPRPRCRPRAQAFAGGGSGRGSVVAALCPARKEPAS